MFIENLTKVGDLVLDPMVGSGTTLVECLLGRRAGVGLDLDPLAVMLSQCKVKRIEKEKLVSAVKAVIEKARANIATCYGTFARLPIQDALSRFDEETKEFIKYWFKPETVLELTSLIDAIEEGEFDSRVEVALKVAFSSVIVTKSGGVTLARDLAHSRAHKDTSKEVPSAIRMFEQKAVKIAYALDSLPDGVDVSVIMADARRVPLDDETVDLIITSPPYAIAIDYVRAHKFSLVWLGYSIRQLSELRGMYIGTEKVPKTKRLFKTEIPSIDEYLSKLIELDGRRGLMVAKYFVDMQEALKEMYRVLRPGKCAIVVVGPSTVRGHIVPTHEMLIKLGVDIGFEYVGRGLRSLDRDKRQLPVSNRSNKSGIEARIHEEYVLALAKC